MNACIRHILVAAAVAALLTGPCYADTAWIEVAGSYYNPDWEQRDSESGVRLSALYGTDRWYASAAYNSTDTAQVDLPVMRLRGLAFGNWREIVGGALLPLGESSTVRLEVAYQGVTLDDSIKSGYMLASAIQHEFGDRISGSLRIGYLQLEEQDWRLTGELEIKTSPRTSLVARLDDFAEFDFTWYEIGLRIRFE